MNSTSCKLITYATKIFLVLIMLFALDADGIITSSISYVAIVALVFVLVFEHFIPPVKASLFGWFILTFGTSIAFLYAPDTQAVYPLISGLWVASAIFFVTSASCKGCNTQESSEHPPWDKLIESLQMSESAKRILYRERELGLLRETVEADLQAGDFHAGLVHCDQMGTVFGAVEEAEALRVEIQKVIHEQHEVRIRNEMTNLQTLLDSRKWVEAYQFAARLRRLFPDSPLLHDIEQLIIDQRTAYRHQLEDMFVEAAKQENPETAMGLLIELDRYLTPEEARKFRDTAESVIATYRENLGARFKMAVSDHRWQEAIEFGEAIMNQFPNTKMTEEVKEMIGTIRTRIVEDETNV